MVRGVSEVVCWRMHAAVFVKIEIVAVVDVEIGAEIGVESGVESGVEIGGGEVCVGMRIAIS